jgi:hypothetical protein
MLVNKLGTFAVMSGNQHNREFDNTVAALPFCAGSHHVRLCGCPCSHHAWMSVCRHHINHGYLQSISPG